MTSTRKTFKINLTPHEAALVLQLICDAHDENTQDLTVYCMYYSADTASQIKEESAALRRVRDALQRQIGSPE